MTTYYKTRALIKTGNCCFLKIKIHFGPLKKRINMQETESETLASICNPYNTRKLFDLTNI